MSKSVKKILTVVAAIAVVYFAPAVSAAIIKGGATGAAGAAKLAAASTATKVITTAAVNAAGNAAIAAATGGDIGKAAIIGAVTGGIGGYTSPVLNPVTTAAAAAPAAAATGPLAGAEAGGTLGGGGGAFVSGGGAVPTTVSGATTFTPTAAAVQTSGMAGTTAATAPVSLGTRAVNVLREGGQAIVAKFTDPKAIADMTLRAAGQLAGSALAGSGLSPEEQKLLAAQAADLQELKNTNQELYNLRLEQAKAILGEAARDYGFETESQARARGAGLTTAAVRGLTGERRRTELARQRRARAEEIATGRTRGELMTAQQTQSARQAGLAALPVAGPQSATMLARSGLMSDYAEAERRRKEASEASGQFFGGLYGKPQAGLMGTEPTQEDRDRDLGARVRNVFGTIV